MVVTLLSGEEERKEEAAKACVISALLGWELLDLIHVINQPAQENWLQGRFVPPCLDMADIDRRRLEWKSIQN